MPAFLVTMALQVLVMLHATYSYARWQVKICTPVYKQMRFVPPTHEWSHVLCGAAGSEATDFFFFF